MSSIFNSYSTEGRADGTGVTFLNKGTQHLRFDPDHHHHQSSSQQQQSSGSLHFSNNSLSNPTTSPSTNMQYPDDLYPLEPLYQQPQTHSQPQYSYVQQQQQ